MMTKQQAFYKSSKWEKFVKIIRFERMEQDGTIICEHCGKPIVSAYDCIAHHATELTEDNVDDFTIAFNPDNIKLVHFGCHNQIHKRFGYRQVQRVYIVWGAPCAGKSTWVDSVAERDDIILDIDRLWAAIRSGACGDYEKPNALKQNIFAIRDCIIDDIRTRRGKWNTAYIIGGYPLDGERERMADLVGADKLIHIDTDKTTCLSRAALKSPEWCDYVTTWFDRYHPPSE